MPGEENLNGNCLAQYQHVGKFQVFTDTNNNSPGQRPSGVLDLQPWVVVFGSRDVYIPPLPREPWSPKLVGSEVVGALLSPLLVDYLGYRFSTHEKLNDCHTFFVLGDHF